MNYERAIDHLSDLGFLIFIRHRDNIQSQCRWQRCQLVSTVGGQKGTVEGLLDKVMIAPRSSEVSQRPFRRNAPACITANTPHNQTNKMSQTLA
ncbi:hypothetical protein SLH49_19800 [Cognatiyoonia sp. IB215446]|uniref:hypothetical protein n=1 Tax=Cognatiyoonia sp. IB215446 TaxID=3097355 RepID=UPI002A0D46A8|nr:hypothetical protein [Cognatiyoonia sp. IB215446]MDX8350242.1 hypothetical protein [Cognatiyoonia sp. IB215446]